MKTHMTKKQEQTFQALKNLFSTSETLKKYEPSRKIATVLLVMEALITNPNMPVPIAFVIIKSNLESFEYVVKRYLEDPDYREKHKWAF